MHGLIISYWKCFVTFRVQCCKSTALQINCELHCEKMDLMTCASSEEPAQSSHLHSLIRHFFGYSTLQKHAYSNKLKILQPKKENFQIKNSDIFHIPA